LTARDALKQKDLSLDKNKVCAHFTSGLMARGDALIGADGLRSEVRSELLGFEPPIYRDFTTWRGLTSHIPHNYSLGYIREFLGRGKGFGFVMLGKDRMYWYAAAQAPEERVVSFGHKKELGNMFQDWFDCIPELIAATEERNIIRTNLYDRVPTLPWSKDSVTLLGDAAHPTLPTLGQGACMALEDALVVTKCLLQHPPAEAFKLYEDRRFPRTKSIVEQSLQSAKMGQLKHPLAVSMRESIMKLMQPVIKRSFQSLHAYRA
jgi:2-polyprenyl-6-methoxyphenol hydroxylase-like FAD-dependent oxidoreductase